MIKRYLNKLDSQKRLWIMSAGITTVILLSLSLLYWPGYLLIRNQSSSLKQNQFFLRWLKRKTPFLLQLESQIRQKAPFEGQSLLAITQHAIDETDLGQFKPEISLDSDQSILVHFEKVHFSSLALFIQRIWEGNQISVKNLNCKSTKEPGVVQTEIKLIRRKNSG